MFSSGTCERKGCLYLQWEQKTEHEANHRRTLLRIFNQLLKKRRIAVFVFRERQLGSQQVFWLSFKCVILSPRQIKKLCEKNDHFMRFSKKPNILSAHNKLSTSRTHGFSALHTSNRVQDPDQPRRTCLECQVNFDIVVPGELNRYERWSSLKDSGV